jgi:hypothetical protein
MSHHNAYQYQNLLTQPKYKELTGKFGLDTVQMTLHNYDINAYQDTPCFQSWSRIAKCMELTIEKKQYFLTNIMLHEQRYSSDLKGLYDCFIENQKLSQSFDQMTEVEKTPEGELVTKLSSAQYHKLMSISNGIRSELFVKSINPWVLVEKSGGISVPMKWLLFKAGSTLIYLLHLCVKSEKEKNKKAEEKKDPAPAFFLATDVVEKIEKLYHEYYETAYPILKTHEIKSLVDDETSWLSKHRNAVTVGSLACMMMLLYCLLNDKFPHLVAQYRVYIFV